MALHIDYRCESLDDFIGNEITIKTIKSIFERKREDIPHCWLFIAPGGTGKTTIARIVSRMIGCEPDPKNQDFQEINAASRGGVDTAREVEKTIQFLPMNKKSKARVYLFEEVQRSSTDFRQAMLNKCMEFMPSHAYLIFCTTDPDKLGKPNGPFRRRCHTFEMQKLKSNEMFQLIQRTIDQEGVDEYFNKEIINVIIEEADGSAGTALAILDKIIDLDTEDMLPAIKLSETSKKQAFELAQKLLNGNWNDVRKVLYDAKKKEFLLDEDPEMIRKLINKYMQTVILKQSNTQSDIFCRALLVLTCFAEPNFYGGKPMLVKCCADVFS